MGNGEFVVSTEALIRIFVFLLYVPVCLFSYWRLIPRLSSISKQIASGFLAAQVVVIVLSIEIQPSSSFEWWLWRMDQEWNIPATLASTQLVMVGGVALMTAWLARARPAWQRLYLVSIGLLFLYLARDEYTTLHEFIPNWINLYAALGATVVVATLVVALRSPRRTWIWHLWLLSGLAMSASGALVLDGAFQVKCGGLGFLRFDECLSGFFLEEPLEFLGIWLVLVAMLGQFSDVSPSPAVRVRRALYVLPVLWILLLSQSTTVLPIARQQVRNAQPASVQFESDVHLHGFRMERKKTYQPHIHLYLSPKRWDFNGLGYSIHLVDQVSGDSIARREKYANRRLEFLLGPGYVPVYRQWLELEIPPQAPVNRAFWIVLTLWREKGDEFVLQEVLASDLRLLDDTQVVLGEIVLPAAATAASPAPLAVFDNGFTLDAIDLPQRAQPGEILTIPFTWRSDTRGSEDHAQFLHFGHEESGTWWVYDQQPLGPRLPTRLWYDGLADSETWQVPLPADLAPGRYKIFTGLYRLRDLERIPASDPEGTPWLDARVLLGSLIIEQ